MRHTSAATGCGRARAVMLVSNPCVNDTRVIRAAETVAALGFDTVVLALSDDGQSSEERRNGVLYKRLGRPWVPVSVVVPLKGTPGRRQRLTFYVLAHRYLSEPVYRLVSPLRDSSDPLRVGLYNRLRDTNRRMLRGAGALDEVAIMGRPLRRLPIGAFNLMVNIAHRVKRKVTGIGRRYFSFVLFRPVFETRRMRRTFEHEVTKLNPSVIHAHDLVMLPAGAAAAISVGAKLIYDAHELEVHRNTRAGLVDKWLRHYLERKNIKLCDATVTVCDSIADHLARVYGVERPVVVMNAPDVEQVLPSAQDLRSSLNLSKDTPLAVYVGRITIGRGIEQIVEALQRLPEFHLALVGAANKPTVDAAVERAMALGLADRLHILAPVPPCEVVSFISSGDLSLVPIQNVCLSYYYCLPNKLLESAIAGLPVVASDLPELKRFVEISGCGVIMDQTDPDDIARAMSEAYESRDRLKPDAERLQRAERIYGWASQRNKLAALYTSFNLLPSQLSSPEPAAKERPRLPAC